jgi:hypothetical protein
MYAGLFYVRSLLAFVSYVRHARMCEGLHIGACIVLTCARRVQLKDVFGVRLAKSNDVFENLGGLLGHLGAVCVPTVAVSVCVVAAIVTLQHVSWRGAPLPKAFPLQLVVLVGAVVASVVLGLDRHVDMCGAMPQVGRACYECYARCAYMPID